MVAGDTRSALRTATAPLHEEIDALFGAFDLGDRAGLTRFLIAQAIGMRACQPRATRFAEQHLGCRPPDYAQVLDADLATLGIDGTQLPEIALPGDITDAGVFYVIAGSRMGATVLRAKATAPTPAGPAYSACGYFNVSEGPAMWRLFRQWLASDAPSSLPAIIMAATATFHLFAKAAQWTTTCPLPAHGADGAGFAA